MVMACEKNLQTFESGVPPHSEQLLVHPLRALRRRSGPSEYPLDDETEDDTGEEGERADGEGVVDGEQTSERRLGRATWREDG